VSSTELDETVTALAVDLVLAMMRSASTDRIPPLKWWTRARTALEVGASSESYQAMVCRMGKSLDIEGALEASSAVMVSAVKERIDSENLWARFRHLCRRDALYIVAFAQIMRNDQRARYDSANAERIASLCSSRAHDDEAAFEYLEDSSQLLPEDL
jgi:hypothetical protein